ncbi:MAG: LptF/LptG family permease [Escherichia coli]|nr:LptF/LptG family permease [Escherichia coli]SQM86015.1 putative permease [Escherichia coli]
MKLVEHYIMRGTRRLVLIIVGFLIFIFASYSAQRYLTEAANGTLALDVVLDIVFYKVLIALEMLLPVGLYVSVGVTLGQMYTDSEITAISAAGGSPGRLYKAVLYLAIPLSIFDVWSSVGLCADLSTGAAVAVGAGCSPVAGKEI